MPGRRSGPDVSKLALRAAVTDGSVVAKPRAWQVSAVPPPPPRPTLTCENPLRTLPAILPRRPRGFASHREGASRGRGGRRSVHPNLLRRAGPKRARTTLLAPMLRTREPWHDGKGPGRFQRSPQLGVSLRSLRVAPTQQDDVSSQAV